MTSFRSTYKGNFRGIGLMLQRPGMRKVVVQKAAEMLPVAQRLSPVGTPPNDKHPGQYRSSFRIEYGEKPVEWRGVKRVRPYGRLVNTAPYAMDVEFGNKRYAGHAPLRKTMDYMKAAHHAA